MIHNVLLVLQCILSMLILWPAKCYLSTFLYPNPNTILIRSLYWPVRQSFDWHMGIAYQNRSRQPVIVRCTSSAGTPECTNETIVERPFTSSSEIETVDSWSTPEFQFQVSASLIFHRIKLTVCPILHPPRHHDLLWWILRCCGEKSTKQ